MKKSLEQKRREVRASGCLGAIVGVMGLGVLTSVGFTLFVANIQSGGFVMATLFGVLDGGILGAATGCAITRFRQKETGIAASICLRFSTYWGALYLTWIVENVLSGSSKASLRINLAWLSFRLLWVAILSICGLCLRKRAM